MEAYVQMDLDEGLPNWLMVLFAVSSTSLIAVNLFALLTSVCLLPTINSFKYVRWVCGCVVVGRGDNTRPYGHVRLLPFEGGYHVQRC